ncbi:hypothetical protein HDV02_004994 [Globomyces sp. JEL0801]|nr:hypothetical protein HDV02_004994 [Globomyces sp. JEL0801]
MSLPRKPDGGGTTGRAIILKANVFPVTGLADSHAFQYDIAITPELPAQKSRRVFQQAEVLIKKLNPNAWFVYDGAKNAFSMADIGDQTFNIVFESDVDMELPPLSEQQSSGGRGGRGVRGGDRGGFRGGRGFDRGARGGRGGGRGGSAPAPLSTFSMTMKTSKILTESTCVGPSEKVKFVIRKTATYNLHELLLYTQGKAAETENVLHATTALSVVLRHIPSMLFTPGFDLLFLISSCYHQSIRAMLAGHLGINVDVASTVFRKGEISVIDFILESMGGRHVDDIKRYSIASLSKILRAVSVVTTHRGDMKQRFRIGKVSKDSANSMKFMNKENKKISVTEYFKTELGVRLQYPDLPLVLKPNGKTAFPIEVLKIIPGQRFKDRMSGQQTADVIRATVQKPADRRAQIENAVKNSLKYEKNPYMDSFGLQVGTEMMDVRARVLPSPKVVFRNNQSANGSDGSWNLRNLKLINSPPLNSFGFIFYVRMSNEEATAIRNVILEKWSKAGMNIKNFNAPVLVTNPNVPANIGGSLKTMFENCKSQTKERCQLVICILDKDAKGLYEQIKRIALLKAGLITQCMLSKHVMRPEEIKDQYIVNVALKANIKIGGTTNTVDRPLQSKLTMYLGADVTHPAPGSMSPSIAAVVASTDPQCTLYNTYVRAQEHRVEIIQALESIMDSALMDFRKKNHGKNPEQVIFFRDGVATGQFKEVKEVEVKALKVSLAKVKSKAPLTFIVVQKRHHIRLFPIDKNEDRSGNCLPGTVIDQDITHPTDFNFILQSHAGLQGMSRPTIYNVIYDEIKMSSDQCQQLCYNLCFLSERATRTISMVAPAYRAHLAAYYARMFIDQEDGSDNMSSKSGGGVPSKIGFTQVAVGIENTMYYM